MSVNVYKSYSQSITSFYSSNPSIANLKNCDKHVNSSFYNVDLANEFSLDYTIVHCTEGYKIANELAAEGVVASAKGARELD